MKKIVAILWHNSANRMRVLRAEIDKIANVSIFSAGSLGDLVRHPRSAAKQLHHHRATDRARRYAPLHKVPPCVTH